MFILMEVLADMIRLVQVDTFGQLIQIQILRVCIISVFMLKVLFRIIAIIVSTVSPSAALGVRVHIVQMQDVTACDFSWCG